MIKDTRKVCIVKCHGKALGIFKTQEAAKELVDVIISEPAQFLSIDEWVPGEFYPWVDFEEDKELDNGR